MVKKKLTEPEQRQKLLLNEEDKGRLTNNGIVLYKNSCKNLVEGCIKMNQRTKKFIDCLIQYSLNISAFHIQYFEYIITWQECFFEEDLLF
jgi:hypothetical protein